MIASTAATWALGARELRRFTRQPSRIVAAVATPALVWLFLASGLARAVQGTDAGYGLYLLPGMATLTVLFASIFTAISLIEDRHQGFLQGVLVSPAPRGAIVLAKCIGGGLPAAAQGALLLASAPLLGSQAGPGGYVLALGVLLAISVAIGGLGIAAAWWVDSSQGFHGIMNTVLMPMWLLSGSVFPLSTSAGWLRTVMLVNPLTWATAGLREAIGGGQSPMPGPDWVIWAVTILSPLVAVALAWRTMRSNT